jgi:hypothetical protein
VILDTVRERPKVGPDVAEDRPRGAAHPLRGQVDEFLRLLHWLLRGPPSARCSHPIAPRRTSPQPYVACEAPWSRRCTGRAGRGPPS